MVFVEQMFAPDTFPPLDEVFLNFLEEVKAIQTTTHTSLVVPAGDIEMDTLHEVRRVHSIIKKGHMSGTWSHFSGTMNRQGVENLLAVPTEDTLEVMLPGQETATVLGTEVHLGPVLTRIRGVRLDEGTIASLRNELGSGQDNVTVHFVSSDQAISEQYFLKWLPNEEIEKLRIQFPSVTWPDSNSSE